MKALSTTKKLTLWWPNSAVSHAEHDVLLMTNALWSYKYGNVALGPGADQDAVLAAASDPTETYDFAWNNADPKTIATRTGLPPITSARWNPDVGHSTNTDDVLNMTFYKTLNIADSAALISSGSTVAVGLIFWPDSSVASDKWVQEGNIEWVADTSTPAGGNNNSNSNNDGATMLAQGLAAGAALLAAFSF